MKIKKNQNSKSGFTLIEFLVVIAIMGIISAIVFFNHSDFSDDLKFKNFLNETALVFREVQTFGTVVKDSKDSQTPAEDFNKPFGLHFDISSSAGDTKKYLVFVDRELPLPDARRVEPEDSNGYNGDLDCNDTECFAEIDIPFGIEIVGLEFKGTTVSMVNKADVLFYRPSPNAWFYYPDSPNTDPYIDAESLIIKFKSAKGREGSITIGRAGQIEINR